MNTHEPNLPPPAAPPIGFAQAMLRFLLMFAALMAVALGLSWLAHG